MTAHPLELGLLGLLDRFRDSGDAVSAHVEEARSRLARETGLEGDALRDRLVEALVESAAIRSGLIGAAAALPFAIPALGPWLSLAAKVGAGTALQLVNEISLVHGISAAYGAPIGGERLRLVAFWLVRLTNYDDLADRALALGVRLSVRRLVEKLVAVGLTRATAATAAGVLGRLAGVRSAGRAPWFVAATGYLGVPVLAALGYRGTRGVGARARAYFDEEVAVAAARAASGGGIAS